METGDDRKLFHGQLFRRLPVNVTDIAFDFRITSQMFRTSKSLQAIDERLGRRMATMTITGDLNVRLDD